MTTIVIVDDHPSTRDGLMTRIELEADLRVVGEAADVDEAFELIQLKLPDIAIIDVSLKTGNGIELIKKVKSANLSTRMLVWSMYEDSLYAERAVRAGAMGYINKENVTGVIIDAIRRILKGDIFLSEAMSAKMLNRVVMGRSPLGKAPVDALSDRELQTFALIGRGLKTADIAGEMQLSTKTIETYRARIKEKLELDDMAALTREAVHWTIENG
ncbi:Oxygen regulatory protein NreC [Planctomycetes bacterium CA13]|uniref:Oxygen regulatory protein NreC n=1 Tax=Novipirellula herctigrandis TaxID=2527986 RepID=A0A5C5YNC5_9BACT|nr:Oxygen regulatory protein NreC [Planctomycetes bacterium CA13]